MQTIYETNGAKGRAPCSDADYLKVFTTDFAMVSQFVVAMEVFRVTFEIVRRQEWLGTQSTDVGR